MNEGHLTCDLLNHPGSIFRGLGKLPGLQDLLSSCQAGSGDRIEIFGQATDSISAGSFFVSNNTGFCALMFKIKWCPFCISGYVYKTVFYCCLNSRVLSTFPSPTAAH